MKIKIPEWGRQMKTVELDPSTPRLITAGCSFSIKPFDRKKYPHAFDDVGAISWPEHLSNKMDRVLIDWAKEGSGSGYAHRVIIDSVLENLGSDLIVVVGWSSVGRWETFTNFNAEFREEMFYDMRASEEINQNNHYRLKEYKQYSLNHTWFQDHLAKLNYIISLGGFLEFHNIKYLFFNAFDPLDGWKEGTGYYGKSESDPAERNKKIDSLFIDGSKDPNWIEDLEYDSGELVLRRATDYIKNNLNWFDKIQIEIGAQEGYRNEIITGNFNNPGKDTLRKKEEYFLDGWHPSPMAHKEWSEMLYNEICN